MTNPKGTKFESLVTGYLNEVDLNAQRTGSELLDEGDIHFGVSDAGNEWTIEAKDHLSIDLPAYLHQLEKSLVRRGTLPFKGAAVVKARGKNVSEAYTVMRLERYRQLVTYVALLEVVIESGTGTYLADTQTTKDFLAHTLSRPQGAKLLPAFAEFVGPEEVEVMADGSEVEAGAVTEDAERCPGCGTIHGDSEDTLAVLARIMGIDPSMLTVVDMGDGDEAAPADVTAAGTIDLSQILADGQDDGEDGDGPELTGEDGDDVSAELSALAELLADPEMAEAADVAADMDAIKAAGE